jgi:hypothetical protein
VHQLPVEADHLQEQALGQPMLAHNPGRQVPAVRSLLGTEVRVMRDRGSLLTRETSAGSTAFLVTVHPSSVLRADDQDTAYAALVADLRVVTAHLGLA